MNIKIIFIFIMLAVFTFACNSGTPAYDPKEGIQLILLGCEKAPDGCEKLIKEFDAQCKKGEKDKDFCTALKEIAEERKIKLED
jgi:hypothetical protein